MAEIITEVCRIENIIPHDNSDNLEICQIKGWKCVTKKGEFKVNQLCVYFTPDTILPQKVTDRLGVSSYCSIKSQGMRIKSVKLRGQVSMGLVIPIEDPTWTEGTDVSTFYESSKYVPPVVLNNADAVAENNLFPRYTEIENLRNNIRVIGEGEEVVISEKIHGCVHQDTKVMLANGEERNISEIEPGIFVLSYDENNQSFIPSKVLNVINKDTIDETIWYELTLENGKKLKCTENHPVLTNNRGWVQAKDLNEKDDIVEN